MALSKDKGKDKEERPASASAEEAAAPEETPAVPPEVAALKKQLQEKTGEAKEHYDKFLRLAADLENLKKRQEKERADLLQFANEKLLKELLPVVDHLELALEHGRQAGAPEAFLEGVELVLQGLLKTLGQFGVTPLDSVGQPFDPAFHNAVMQQEAPAAPDCSVLQELQRGYLLHNRLLRPAMVVVARHGEQPICQSDSKVQEEG